jgi:translation initiation factor 1 (eIF-1/SUI1)
MKKKNIVMLAGFVAAVAIIILLLGKLSAAGDRLSSLTEMHEEVLRFRDEHRATDERLKRFEGRKNLTSVQGLAHAVDEIFEPLGLKGKVKSLKHLGSKENAVEKAEVTVQGVDMNEMVNFLYAHENTAMPLTIKKINIRTSFENPERLNVTMTLSFIKSE